MHFIELKFFIYLFAKMRYLILFLICTTLVQCMYQQVPFDNIQTEQQQLEEDLYNAVNTFLDSRDPDDAKKNCDSCLSMLRMTKRFCYFPERIQLAAMTNICKRSKQVDNQVVRCPSYLFFITRSSKHVHLV